MYCLFTIPHRTLVSTHIQFAGSSGYKMVQLHPKYWQYLLRILIMGVRYRTFMANSKSDLCCAFAVSNLVLWCVTHENKSRLDWFIWHLMPRGHAKVLGKAIPFISRKICDGTCATQRFDNFSFIEIPYYYVQTLFMWKNILHFVVC